MDKALLVGINKYQDSNANLKGCVNDVKLMYQLLINHFKFPLDNIRVLTDERATKQNILERLSWLVSNTKPGDNIYFHYSGHGAQIRDRSNDELNDYVDEILCPHDMNWSDPLLDDYIYSYLKLVPKGVYILFIADCCHSATISRSGFTQDYQVPRRLMPPFDIHCRQMDRNLKINHFGKRDYFQDQNHILLSGCKDDKI